MTKVEIRRALFSADDGFKRRLASVINYDLKNVNRAPAKLITIDNISYHITAGGFESKVIINIDGLSYTLLAGANKKDYLFYKSSTRGLVYENFLISTIFLAIDANVLDANRKTKLFSKKNEVKQLSLAL